MARMLISLGLGILVLGILVGLGERLPLKLGRLPGDILYRGRNTTFYFPVVTCLLISAILSLVGWFVSRR